MSKIKNKSIEERNEQAELKKIIGKPVRWETPNFLINFVDYFGVDSLRGKSKPIDYYNKLFN